MTVATATLLKLLDTIVDQDPAPVLEAVEKMGLEVQEKTAVLNALLSGVGHLEEGRMSAVECAAHMEELLAARTAHDDIAYDVTDRCDHETRMEAYTIVVSAKKGIHNANQAVEFWDALNAYKHL